MIPTSSRFAFQRDIIVLTVLLALLFGLFLGSRPLSVPDEGRYAEIPREMAVTGDWVTPRLNGVKYFEKPPLVYWLTALSITVLGLSEWAVRIAPALFALLGCLAVYAAGAVLYNRLTGILSSIVLATSTLYYALGRTLTLDMPVTALLTVSLCSFLLALREPAGGKRRALLYLFYAGCGLTMLTKGMIAIAIPGMIIFTWLLVMGQWGLLRSLYLPTGTALFLVISAPWHLLVQRINPEFFDFYIIHEHFQRYLTTVHGRYKPFWYFIPVLVGGLFPWCIFLFQALRRSLPPSWKERHQHQETVFLLLWAALVFLFFSASHSKLVPYILPVFPPLALIIGSYLAEAWDKSSTSGFRGAYAVLFGLSAAVSAALMLLPRYRQEVDQTAFRPYAIALIAILFTGIAAGWHQYRKHGIRRSLTAIIAGTVIFLTVANTAMSFIDTRSMKDEARVLKQFIRPDDEVVSYHTYYQDLPVYLERRITVVEWTGELWFGTTVEDTSSWIISESEFWKRWNAPKRVFVVTNQANYATLLNSGLRHYRIVEQSPSPQHVILVNQEQPL